MQIEIQDVLEQPMQKNSITNFDPLEITVDTAKHAKHVFAEWLLTETANMMLQTTSQICASARFN